MYAPRRNGDSPHPPTRRLVCPLPAVSGGRGTLAGEKGVGRVPIPTRGIRCGTLYMYVLCGAVSRVISRHRKHKHNLTASTNILFTKHSAIRSSIIGSVLHFLLSQQAILQDIVKLLTSRNRQQWTK